MVGENTNRSGPYVAFLSEMGGLKIALAIFRTDSYAFLNARYLYSSNSQLNTRSITPTVRS